MACSSGSTGEGQGGDEAGAEASSGDVASPDASTKDDGSALLPTFTAVWADTLMTTCALLFCHGGTDDFLSMATKDTAYASMVGVVSRGPMCGQSGLTIVSPGDPDASLLYLKITNPPCGNKMPAQYGLSLDDEQIEQIRQWIAQGARDD